MENIRLVIHKRVRTGEESDYGSCWEEQVFFDQEIPIGRVPCVGEEIELAGEQFEIKRVIWPYEYDGPLKRRSARVEAR